MKSHAHAHTQMQMLVPENHHLQKNISCKYNTNINISKLSHVFVVTLCHNCKVQNAGPLPIRGLKLGILDIPILAKETCLFNFWQTVSHFQCLCWFLIQQLAHPSIGSTLGHVTPKIWPTILYNLD